MAIGRYVSEYWSLFEWGSTALLVLALLISYVVVFRIGDGDSPTARLRERFVLGVPWGTLVVCLGLYAIFHVLQGAGEPGGPNVVGFRSWSLWYPQSLLVSAFAHASNGHLTGNLLGTVAFAPIVEYAWGHFPTGRGQQTFSSWRTNPFARIGLFVVGTVVAGLLGALLVPGAVIGFSGVVFAYAGFAIISRPLYAAVAMLGLDVLDLVYDALTSPLSIAEGRTRFVSPWWADTALQGHLFGMVVGVLLAVLLFRYRNRSPKVRYIWFAAAVFAASRSMWAIFWYLGASEYLLFRGVGAASVLVLASIVTLAALSSDLSVFPKRVGVPVRSVALSVLVGLVVLVALVGVPYNLVGVTPGEEVDGGINVDGYTVTYAENVENEYAAIDIPVVGELLSVEMSGVIVTSDRRNVWAMDTPKPKLAFEGNSVVVVGDTTWRELVIIDHTQWQTRGGNTTYKVAGQHWGEMDNPRLLYEAESAQVEPTINGTRVSIVPADDFYDVVVSRHNETLGRAKIPPHNQTVSIANITFEREKSTLIATHERTEIPIATYRTERDE